MKTEYRFTFSLRNGLHARPASMLAEAARPFKSTLHIRKGDSQTWVDLRSVLSLVGMDVKHGDECVICVEGDDSDAALEALIDLIDERLAEGDDQPLPSDDCTISGECVLPVILARLDPAIVTGRAVSGGVGHGVAVVVKGLSLSTDLRNASSRGVEKELSSFKLAASAIRDELSREAAKAHGMERDLLNAHAGIAEDPALLADVDKRISAGATAPQALVDAADAFSKHLSAASSAYIRDRVVDVQDVAMQLLDRLTNGAAGSLDIHLEEDSIVFADTLTAGQLLRMVNASPPRLRGLVLGGVGATSHTVIIARSHRIPTIIDVPNAAHAATPGTAAIVDGDGGFCITTVTPAVSRHYSRRDHVITRRAAAIAPAAREAGITSDGQRLEVGCNAATAEEVIRATADGAEGVGLLRTELLFLERKQAPTEDEQFEAYSAVVRAAAGRPVIIRTFDIGGDKPATYLAMPAEENPFLGVRGLRLYESHPKILRCQLRAILRASAIGPVKIMAPMVSLPSEAAWFRAQVETVKQKLRDEKTPFDESTPVGIMVEVPSTALVMDQLCLHADFFSIGTNDLTQYLLAVDRGNAGVASLYNSRHPALLRCLKMICDGAIKGGRWVGICGEMASDPLNLPLMIGLGLNEISVTPSEVTRIKSQLRQADSNLCRAILQKACDSPEAVAVTAILTTEPWKSAAPQPILDLPLIEVNADATTKEEAIRAGVDLLFAAARTDNPDEVERAVWAREATYSTGLGHGFAIPHCKTAAVTSPTLAVLKLAAPVEWGSLDALPVSVVMLLAIPANDTTGAHMKVFAKLARKLMHDEFRDRVTAAATPQATLAVLTEELAL